ncbi:VUT family protein [Micromonospora sp. NPDC023633]|uniref:VUT family protein n=1 Tax=Micromonospora sp. NPDC023633 TaxID=3154320 RepID=UPI003400F6AD
MTRPARIFTLAATYISTIAAANWAVATYGAIPIGLGLLAPAGVLFAGLAFTLRDLLHEAAGWAWTVAAIFAGTALSVAIAGPGLALAAGAAFLVSELADLAVYTPLRRRRWLLAVAASNAVGLVVDSALFLWLAFGSLAFLPGQIVGKTYMTVAAVIVLATIRARRRTVVA